MKTFIAALAILISVLIFVLCNMVSITQKIDAMLTIAERLPSDKTEFEGQDLASDVTNLWQFWDGNFGAIAFTCGYDNLNRADDAMLSLFISWKNQNADDFCVARKIFCDSLERLRKLESFHIDGLF